MATTVLETEEVIYTELLYLENFRSRQFSLSIWEGFMCKAVSKRGFYTVNRYQVIDLFLA